jgi:hypothetical protein
MAPDRVQDFLHELFADSMHAKRVLSLGNAVVGAIHAAALGVHAIGKALAVAAGLEPKFAIKQVDRLLSNMRLDVWALFPVWVRFLLSDRKEVVTALDWTDFDDDGHSTIALNMITSHGRATPLMWKTHEKAKLAKHRNLYEDELLAYFRQILPTDVKVTVLADRGFGDQAMYKSLIGAHMDFVIRFRGCIHVTDVHDKTTTAAELVPPSGRAKKLSNVRVTHAKTAVPAVVCVKAKNMKDA